MKNFFARYKKVLLCLLVVLLLGITVYTVCCFNGWGVKMSQMPAPYLWIYLRTNGYPDSSYETANAMRFGIEKLEESIRVYERVVVPYNLSLPDAAEGWADLAEVVADYYGLEYTNPFND